MNDIIIKILFVLLGGSIGALSRYLLSGFIYEKYYSSFPIGTLIVNLIAVFILGLFWGFIQYYNTSSNLNIFIIIGFLGGFSTYASYIIETFQMFQDGQLFLPFLNIFLTNILGFIFLFLGIFLSQIFINFIK